VTNSFGNVLQKQIVIQLVKWVLNFVEPEGSLPDSQESAVEPLSKQLNISCLF
jgi:hypothetical protein